MRTVLVLAFTLHLAVVPAQGVPDLSGVWTLDPARSDATGIYGQLRVVRQDATALNMTVVNHDGRSRVMVFPWTFRFGQWGPRRGPDGSRAPRTNARWMDDKLVLVKAPGEIGAALWVWTLSPDGNELVVETVNPAVSWESDLRAVSPMALRHRHVYVRQSSANRCRDCFFTVSHRQVTWNPRPAGEFAFRLDQHAVTLEATCRAVQCLRIDLFGGRRIGSLPLARGAVTNIGLSSETILETTP